MASEKTWRLWFGVVAGLLVCLAFLSTARADGLLYRLPPDGTWVQYTLKQHMEMPKQKNVTLVGALSLASVGEEMVNYQTCRWIEVVIDTKGPDGQGLRSVFKALIPEKRLKKGQNPAHYWLKGWGKMGDQEPQALTREFLANPAMIINLVVAGPLENPRELSEKQIETKLGKLDCRGIAGTLTYSGAAIRVDKGKKMTKKDLIVHVETYLHEAVPFGVMTSRQQVTFPDFWAGARSVEMDLTLLDVGTDAKSELPDQK
jgi:hypothetical protein